VTGPAGVTVLREQTFNGCDALREVFLRPGLETIERWVFGACPQLGTITIPSTVTWLDSSAFGRPSVHTIVFAGRAPNAPLRFFDSPAPAIVVLATHSNSFFGIPWVSASRRLGLPDRDYPAASWHLDYGLPFDANLNQDTNGDGVSNLMAYALDLDPHLPLRNRLPQPQLTPTTLGLNFFAEAQGVEYWVESSDELGVWSTNGVAMTPVGPDGWRQATVARGSTQRFLRLRVSAASP
jgi:hypothetical protein